MKAQKKSLNQETDEDAVLFIFRTASQNPQPFYYFSYPFYGKTLKNKLMSPFSTMKHKRAYKVRAFDKNLAKKFISEYCAAVQSNLGTLIDNYVMLPPAGLDKLWQDTQPVSAPPATDDETTDDADDSTFKSLPEAEDHPTKPPLKKQSSVPDTDEDDENQDHNQDQGKPKKQGMIKTVLHKITGKQN